MPQLVEIDTIRGRETIEFPDNTPPEEIEQAIRSNETQLGIVPDRSVTENLKHTAIGGLENLAGTFAGAGEMAARLGGGYIEALKQEQEWAKEQREDRTGWGLRDYVDNFVEKLIHAGDDPDEDLYDNLRELRYQEFVKDPEPQNPVEAVARESRQYWEDLAQKELSQRSANVQAPFTSDLSRTLTDPEKVANSLLELLIGTGPTLALAAAGGTAPGAIMGALQEASGAYGQAVDEGMGGGEALGKAMLYGGQSYVLNKVGLDRIFSKLPQSVSGKIASAAITGGVEGVTEGGEEIAQFATFHPDRAVAAARQLLAEGELNDDARKVLQDFVEVGIPSVIFGAGANVAHDVITRPTTSIPQETTATPSFAERVHDAATRQDAKELRSVLADMKKHQAETGAQADPNVAVLVPAIERTLQVVDKGSISGQKVSRPKTQQKARETTRVLDEGVPLTEPVKTKGERAQAEEELQAPLIEPKPFKPGKETSIEAEGFPEPISGRYALMELSDLIASHDFSSGAPRSNVRTGVYPQGLQPREYAEGSPEAAKVVRLAREKKSGYYISSHPGADSGPPTVVPTGHVINGNARTMSLQYAAGAKDAGWYFDQVKKEAANYGIDPTEAQGMSQPVLVRVVDMDVRSNDAVRFARAGNVSTTQAQSPARMASSLGDLIKSDLLNTIQLDEDTTFSEAVTGSREGAEFRQALRDSLPPQQVPQYFHDDGRLTESGVELVRHILLTKVFPVELVERLGEERRGLKRTLEGAIPQLLKVMRDYPDQDITPQLTEALEFLGRNPEVRSAQDADNVLGQMSLIEGGEERITPGGRMLLDFVLQDGGKPRVFRQKLTQFLSDLSYGTGLFAEQAPDPLSAAAEALGVEQREGAVFGREAASTSPREPHADYQKLVRAHIIAEKEPEYVPPEQLELPLRDAEAAAKRANNVSGRGGRRRTQVGGPGGVVTLGSRVTRTLARKGRIDLRGQTFQNTGDLAALLQVFRDPRIETFYIVYVNKEGRVLAHEGITSGFPGQSFAYKYKGGLRHTAHAKHVAAVRRRMRRLGADGYYLVHNHPSGEVGPSEADRSLTRQHAIRIPGLIAHIIIDHDRYSVSIFKTHKDPFPDFHTAELPKSKQGKPFRESAGVFGRTHRTPEDTARIFAELETTPNKVTVLYNDPNYRLNAAQNIPPGILSSHKHTMDFLRGQARRFGASRLIIGLHSRPSPDNPIGQTIETMLINGDITAVFYLDTGDFTISPAANILSDETFLGAPIRGRAVREPGARYSGKQPAERLAARPGMTVKPGRPDLANPGITDEARKVVDTLDQWRNKQGKPERRSDEERDQVAGDLVANDYEDVRQRLLDTAQRGGQLSDVETIAAKKVVDREGFEALSSGNRTRLELAVNLANAWRETGTEQARAFRARFDPTKTAKQLAVAAISDAILKPSKDTARQMDRINRRLRKKGLPDSEVARLREEKDKLLRKQAQEIERLRRALERDGVDVANLDALVEDRYKAAHVYREVSAHKSSVWDALHEYYLSAILSGPQTHAANLIGNTVSSGWDFTVQRAAEVMVNQFVRDPHSAQVGEFRHMLAGMGPGFVRGLRNALASWRTETPMFEDELQGEKHQKVETLRGPAIRGRKGRVIRVPLRALMVMDEFQKSIIAQMEAGAQAYRIAKSEGLKGKDISRRVAELVADYSSDAWARAVDKAVELTFQAEMGRTGKAVQGLRSGVPFARYVLPFIKTPMNIFKMGMRKTPLGSLNMMFRWATDPTYSKHEKVKHAGEQIVAWALTYALATILGDDENGEPWITGTVPYKGTKRGERELAYRTAPPQSIRIGDKWYSYKRIEPFATSLATMVDALSTLRRADKQEFTKTLGDLQSHLIAQMQDKTFLRGLSDILDAYEDGRGTARWAGNFVSAWVPNIARQTARASDENIRETGYWGQGHSFSRRFGHRLRYKMLPTSRHALPRVDLWGREIRKGRTPGSDFLWRLLAPVDVVETHNRSKVEIVLDRAILNWNNQHPDDTFAPQRPAYYYRMNGKTHYWADEQYHDLSVMAGKEALRILRGRRINVEEPTERDIQIIRKALETGRRKAREATGQLGQVKS